MGAITAPLLKAELHRVMVVYRVGPRELDEWYLGELIDAHYMMPTHRRERIIEMAVAMNMAKATKKSEWDRAIRELGA